MERVVRFFHLPNFMNGMINNFFTFVNFAIILSQKLKHEHANFRSTSENIRFGVSPLHTHGLESDSM